MRHLFGRLFLSFALVGAVSFVAVPAVAASGHETELQAVLRVARNQIGDPWRFRARGPNAFDCSGLVFFAFNQNGLKERIGGYRSAAGYYRYFKSIGKADMNPPRVGDLVVWGHYEHIGIFLGDGKAISTLTTRGVWIHPVKGYVPIRVKAYLHVDLQR
jgi:cell wall-associated NlpC family hydrolase